MDRQEAIASIRENVENENLVRHMLATEAIMRALARRVVIGTPLALDWRSANGSWKG